MLKAMESGDNFDTTPHGFAKLMYNSSKAGVKNEGLLTRINENLLIVAGSFERRTAFGLLYGALRLSAPKSIIFFAQRELLSCIDKRKEIGLLAAEVKVPVPAKERKRDLEFRIQETAELMEALSMNKNLDIGEKLTLYELLIRKPMGSYRQEIMTHVGVCYRVANAMLNPIFFCESHTTAFLKRLGTTPRFSNVHLLADFYQRIHELVPKAQRAVANAEAQLKEIEAQPAKHIDKLYNDFAGRLGDPEKLWAITPNSYFQGHEFELEKAGKLADFEHSSKLAKLKEVAENGKRFAELKETFHQKLSSKEDYRWRYNVGERRFYTYEELKAQREDVDVSAMKNFPTTEFSQEQLELYRKKKDYFYHKVANIADRASWDPLEAELEGTGQKKEGETSVMLDDRYEEEEEAILEKRGDEEEATNAAPASKKKAEKKPEKKPKQ